MRVKLSWYLIQTVHFICLWESVGIKRARLLDMTSENWMQYWGLTAVLKLEIFWRWGHFGSVLGKFCLAAMWGLVIIQAVTLKWCTLEVSLTQTGLVSVIIVGQWCCCHFWTQTATSVYPE